MNKIKLFIVLTSVVTGLIPLHAAKITAAKVGSKINVTIDGKYFTSYICSSDEKYPFFYPVNGPLSGGSVTSMRNGEYPHHSSLFFGCDQVNGGNYWQDVLDRGRIISVNAEILKEGGDSVVISDECMWSRPGALSPIKDSRKFTITSPSANIWLIDAEITMEMLIDVTIKKTNHSLFSVRMAADLSVKNGVFVDFDSVLKVKKQIREKETRFKAAYAELINKADIALTEGPFSVTGKKRLPPSGDKHDYLSMGPYWWPDPSKPDGLPYIVRDGEVNPETSGENVDRDTQNKFFSNLESLAWAFYFSGDVKYAEKAVKLLETWFVNTDTKMNPNLNYAQGIPGRCEGRGIGIIDFSRIDKLIPAIQVLENQNKFSIETKGKLYEWFDRYLSWLNNSDYGKNEYNGKNNHGTWYDVQTAGIALFLGKNEMAKSMLENVKTKRIAMQVEPDGSQPLEIARTRSLTYSTMNLRGFINLANMAQTVGVDLWNFETTDGRGIRKALDFLIPYVSGKENWEHQQISSEEEAMKLLELNYLIAAVKTGDNRYLEVAQSISKPATKLEILLYPLF